ncbi:hypothetical protein HK405_000372, partial [Cladochytrium tenue]
MASQIAPDGRNPFVDKANELLVPLLRFPAYDTCTALLLLAWCEFRENYDSGFWDRVISFYTGRPVTIPETMCEIALPNQDEFVEISGAGDDDAAALAARPRQPFPYAVRLMVLCGRLSDALNSLRGAVVGDGVLPVVVRRRFVDATTAIQRDLQAFYASLPPDVAWTTDNFKRQASACQG